ncbi:MAG: nucleotidyltransferase domain-containing protein, partial [Chloroflexota bacterium]
GEDRDGMLKQIPAEVEEKIQLATRLLVEAANPARIILFGSYARGDFDTRSDLDLLVILPGEFSNYAETVRLYGVLSHLHQAVDIVVYSEADVEERKDLRGTMLHHALKEGVVLHDTA